MATDRNINFARNIIQKAVKDILDFYRKWKIKINPGKTEAITFTKRSIPDRPIKIENERLPWSNTVKYLGITMDKKLIWQSHIQKTKKKAQQQISILYPLLNKKSKLSTKTKLIIFNSYIKPILIYGSPAWCFASKTLISTLQTTQNKTLRQIVNAQRYVSNRTIFRDLHQTTIKEDIRSLTEKTYNTAQSHNNPLIRLATDYNPDDIQKHKRPRMTLT